MAVSPKPPKKETKSKGRVAKGSTSLSRSVKDEERLRRDILIEHSVDYLYGNNGEYSLPEEDVRTIASMVSVIREDFPEIGLVKVWGADAQMMNDYYPEGWDGVAGLADYESNGIVICKDHLRENGNWHMKDTAAHETGHLAYAALCKRFGEKGLDDWNRATIMNDRKSAWEQDTTAHRIVRNALSSLRESHPLLAFKSDEQIIQRYLGNYALTNPNETIAVSFAHKYYKSTTGTMREPLSEAIVRELRKELNKR